MNLINLIVFSALNILSAKSHYIDSSKYDCPLLPTNITENYVIQEKMLPANSLKEVWERLKMVLLPDSHYMWVYLLADVYAKYNVTVELIDDMTVKVNHPQKTQKDAVIVKDFAINDGHHCHTVKMESKAGAKMLMIKLEETADHHVIISHVGYDCSYPRESGICQVKTDSMVNRLYTECLVISKDIDACINYVKDPAYHVVNAVKPTCSFLPKNFHKYGNYAKKLNSSITIDNAWDEVKLMLDPENLKTLTNAYQGVIADETGIKDLAGKNEYMLALKNPDGYGNEFLSTTTIQLDNATNCYKTVNLGRLPDIQVNTKYTVAFDLTEDAKGDVYIQAIVYECLSSNGDYKAAMCYYAISHHLKTVVTYMKCMIEDETLKICIEKAANTWRQLETHM